MPIAYPLNGTYSGGQHVIVEGKWSQEELDLFGRYGTDLVAAQRKDPKRRGPSDQQLLSSCLSTSEDCKTALSLHEAYFLSFAFGCLKVVSPTDDVHLKPAQLWSLFRDYHIKTRADHDFAVEFAIYLYFRTRGWIVKGGENYGVNFMLYREGPALDHAQYAIKIIRDEEDCSYKWNSLVTFHRVIQTAGKDLVLVFVQTDNGGAVDFSRPECIGRMRVLCRIFSGHINLQSDNTAVTSSSTLNPW